MAAQESAEPQSERSVAERPVEKIFVSVEPRFTADREVERRGRVGLRRNVSGLARANVRKKPQSQSHGSGAKSFRPRRNREFGPQPQISSDVAWWLRGPRCCVPIQARVQPKHPS